MVAALVLSLRVMGRPLKSTGPRRARDDFRDGESERKRGEPGACRSSIVVRYWRNNRYRVRLSSFPTEASGDGSCSALSDRGDCGWQASKTHGIASSPERVLRLSLKDPSPPMQRKQRRDDHVRSTAAMTKKQTTSSCAIVITLYAQTRSSSLTAGMG